MPARLFSSIVDRLRKHAPFHSLGSLLYRGTRKGSRAPKKSSEMEPPHVSYSQCGEDLIVKYIFDARGVRQPDYLDIGAYDPCRFSNTALFYLLGSSGINVEANPSRIAKFRRLRPRDTVVCAAVTEKSGPCSLVVPEGGETLAFVEPERVSPEDQHCGKRVSIAGLSLDDLLDQFCAGKFPDFLSLDVEGLDVQILKQAPFHRTKPKIICVETISYSTTGHGVKDPSIAEILGKNGYIQYADTNINTIFVLESFWRIG